MKFLLVFIPLFIATDTKAENVFRIEIGSDYKSYSQSDMQRRIWELERAVFQLQQRVFQLEATNSPTESWICTVKAMGDTFTGTGGSKAVAKSKALENCKAARKGDGFFCKDDGCEK